MAAFSTTHWSVILLAQGADQKRARQALEHVCQRYWYPLYAFARRRGYQPAKAEDATQDFFMHLHQKELLLKTRREAGLFRTFMLTIFKNHLSSAERKEGRLKRGGGATFVSMDPGDGEERFSTEPLDDRSPENLFERSWAMNLLHQAMAILKAEYEQSGRAALWVQLHQSLLPEVNGPTYRELGRALGQTEGSVKVAAHRMRQRYREILIGLIASTVSDPAEVRRELRHLLAVLS